MSGRSIGSPTKSARRPTTRGSPTNLTSELSTRTQTAPVTVTSQPNSATDVTNTDVSRPMLERFVDGAEATSVNSAEDSLANRQLFEDMGEDDPDAAEWAQLRCSSVQTEVIAERSRRNRQPSAGYPGLSFGTSVFGSNTMMRLRIISNELHNIMNVYLKRAEGEIVALNNRVKVLEDDLGKSEQGLKVATTSLEEAAQAVSENEIIGEEIQSRTSMEDGRLALLDFQLNKAKELAEETDKNYKDMAKRISLEESVPFKLGLSVNYCDKQPLI